MVLLISFTFYFLEKVPEKHRSQLLINLFPGVWKSCSHFPLDFIKALSCYSMCINNKWKMRISTWLGW